MNPHFEEFLEEFAPQVDVIQPTQGDLDHYKNIIPAALLDFWSESGWSGYSNGIFWSTNPAELEPVLQYWLAATGVLSNDTYTVIGRSAFGDLYLWGAKTGASVVIHPLTSSVTTKELNAEIAKGNSDAAVSAFFLSKDKDYFDFEDFNDKPLFSRAVKKLGPPEADEMYAFEPALSIGGMPKIENLVKVKMIEHLVLLSQLSPIEITHLDVGRHT
jgi:hypothetical protein